MYLQTEFEVLLKTHRTSTFINLLNATGHPYVLRWDEPAGRETKKRRIPFTADSPRKALETAAGLLENEQIKPGTAEVMSVLQEIDQYLLPLDKLREFYDLREIQEFYDDEEPEKCPHLRYELDRVKGKLRFIVISEKLSRFQRLENALQDAGFARDSDLCLREPVWKYGKELYDGYTLCAFEDTAVPYISLFSLAKDGQGTRLFTVQDNGGILFLDDLQPPSARVVRGIRDALSPLKSNWIETHELPTYGEADAPKSIANVKYDWMGRQGGTLTNYFFVEDDEKFFAVMEKCAASALLRWFGHMDAETDRHKYAFGCDGGLLGYIQGNNNPHADCMDRFYEALQGVLPEGEVIIITEVRYNLFATAECRYTIITKNTVESASTHDLLDSKASILLDNPDFKGDYE